MAPVVEGVSELVRRAYYCSSGYYSNGSCYNSAWYWWGRWVFAGVVIIVVIGILVLLGCVNARRRRRRGLQPMYGTGWMGGKPGQAYNNPQAYGPPPPQYSQNTVPSQYTGQTYTQEGNYYPPQTNAHDGSYYPPQNNNYGPQQPANVYNRGGDENVYAPPAGPPPGKVA